LQFIGLDSKCVISVSYFQTWFLGFSRAILFAYELGDQVLTSTGGAGGV